MGVYSGIRSISENCSYDNAGYQGNVLGLLVENTKNELNMFNSVISLDFAEAYSEAYLGEASDNKEKTDSAKGGAVKNIFSKIKGAFDAAIDRIKKFFGALATKVSNLIHNDKKLVEKYSKSFWANYKTYTLKDFKRLNPTGGSEQVQARIKAVEGEYKKSVGFFGAEHWGAIDPAKIKERTDDLKEKLKTQAADLNADAIFLISEPVAEHTLTNNEATSIEKTVKESKTIISDINKAEKTVIESLKAARKELNVDGKGIEDANKDVARANAKYQIATAYINYCSQISSKYAGAAQRYIAYCRRIYVQVGKGKVKTNEAYGVPEDVYDYILGEASDIYVESSLALD